MRELDRALQTLRPGDWSIEGPEHGAAWQRAELVVPDTDPLLFLHGLGGSVPAAVHYWSDRRHALQSAGLGIAAEVRGDAGFTFADVCGGVRALIGCRRQRLYGGFRFGAPLDGGPEPLGYAPMMTQTEPALQIGAVSSQSLRVTLRN